MNKTKLIAISGTLCLGLVSSMFTSNASEFDGQEDKYIELCTSSTLSTSEQDTCREFNTYLKEKNDSLKNDTSAKREEAEKSKSAADELAAEISALQEEIVGSEEELAYIESTITSLETSIKEKHEEVKDRMYVLQSKVNTNMFVDYIFDAKDFTELLSRIESVDELTAYDKDLITGLAQDQEELKKQKESVVAAKNNLDQQYEARHSLQGQYLAAYQEQNSAVASNENVIANNDNAAGDISENLAALEAALEESRVEDASVTPPPVVEQPVAPTPDPVVPETPSDPSNPEAPATPETPSTPETPTPEQPSTPPASNIGYEAAQLAVSKIGSPYGWGASGPNSFDCSGLVSWAYNNAGYNIGRQTTYTLVNMGSPVAYSDLQAGDVILFNTDGPLSHTGIYLGGGRMVHAPMPGQNVQVSYITSSYWQQTYHSARRLA